MPCSFCRHQVIESGATWGYHHHNLAQFNQSIEEGCSICLHVADILVPLENWLTESERRDEAVYRWTLRKSAALRHSRQMVILQLRPNLTDNENMGKANGRSKLPDISFHMMLKEDFGTMPAIKNIGRSTDSDNSFHQITQWVKNCESNHEKCVRKHLDKNFMPTRLIDLGPPESPLPERFPIIKTGDSNIKGPYVTLSHCWGDSKFVKLEEKTFHEFTSWGVPAEKLKTNQNFIDAITVARKLKVRYMWIDSLCINQTSQDDWEKESDLMHKVYRNSFCNIAAAASSNANEGLFRSRNEKDILKMSPEPFVPEKNNLLLGRKNWVVIPPRIYEDLLLQSPLYQRAWVFQERLLSPRLVHFGQKQIFWDCSTLTACESLPTELPIALDEMASTDRNWRLRLQDAALSVSSIGDAAIDDFWSAAVHAYTSCRLTKQTDKIKAIWGVAKLVRDTLGQDFGVGIWALRLVDQLCWKVVSGSGRGRRGQRPPDLRMFPSWTWASVDGTIQVGKMTIYITKWWAATGIETDDICFTLTEPVFPNAGKGRHTWAEEIEKLNDDIAKMVEMGSQLEVMALMKRKESVISASKGALPARPGKVSLDRQPRLAVVSIGIRSHIMRGILRKKATEEDDWIIDALVGSSTINTDGKDGFIYAYPDEVPETDELICEFTFLWVGRQDLWNDWSNKNEGQDEFEEEELEQMTYTGAGILLERADPSLTQTGSVAKTQTPTFKRCGAVSFERLSHGFWSSLRRSCCEGAWDTDAEEYHDLHGGQGFYII